MGDDDAKDHPDHLARRDFLALCGLAALGGIVSGCAPHTGWICHASDVHESTLSSTIGSLFSQSPCPRDARGHRRKILENLVGLELEDAHDQTRVVRAQGLYLAHGIILVPYHTIVDSMLAHPRGGYFANTRRGMCPLRSVVAYDPRHDLALVQAAKTFLNPLHAHIRTPLLDEEADVWSYDIIARQVRRKRRRIVSLDENEIASGFAFAEMAELDYGIRQGWSGSSVTGTDDSALLGIYVYRCTDGPCGGMAPAEHLLPLNSPTRE